MVLASLNTHKLQEFTELFRPYPEVEIVAPQQFLRNADKLSQVENHDTYLENAVAKARLCNQGCHHPSLADDSGLEVQALEGKPGVRSHRYATEGGSNLSSQAQGEANMAKLLNALKGKSEPERAARFVCTLALVVEGILVHATGILEGTILTEKRGSQGFGYDPLFVPKGSTKTLAEMTENEKNAISHRGQAVHSLMSQIKAHGIVLVKP